MFLFNRNKGYENIDIKHYRSEFSDNGIAHILVDVRTRNEYTQGRIPNAVNIPLDELGTRLGEISKENPIIVVCATGNRSRTGANILVEAGYENVSNLKGGTMSWMMSGHPIEA